MPANHNHYFSGRHLPSSNPYCCAKFLFHVHRASLLHRRYLTSRGQCTDHAADDIATLSGWHLLHGVADQAGYLRAQGIAEGAVHPLRVPSWCLQLAIYAWEDLADAPTRPRTAAFGVDEWTAVLRVAQALVHTPLRALTLASLDRLTRADLVERLVLAEKYDLPAWRDHALASLRNITIDRVNTLRLRRVLAPETYKEVCAAGAVPWTDEQLGQTPCVLDLDEYRELLEALDVLIQAESGLEGAFSAEGPHIDCRSGSVL